MSEEQVRLPSDIKTTADVRAEIKIRGTRKMTSKCLMSKVGVAVRRVAATGAEVISNCPLVPPSARVFGTHFNINPTVRPTETP